MSDSETVKRVLGAISQERVIELTKTLVSIPSVAGKEGTLANWMENYFREIGLEDIGRLPVEESGDSVYGWINGKAEGPAMMLNFHLDTFEAFAGWETDPHQPLVENGRLYGLGAHDMKGGGACILAAVEALLQSRVTLNGRLLVATTTDEENWSRGAHALIESGQLEDCRYCMVPEPTPRGTLRIGQRGRHVFHLSFRGKTVHAAYGGGVNAVTDAARVAGLLADGGLVDLGYDERFGMGGSICVTGLHGGGTLILVPEEAEMYIDRHILPGQTAEEAAAQIEAVLEQAKVESTVTLTWDERPTPAPLPFEVPEESRFVQSVKRNLEIETGDEVRFVLGRSVADTNHFAVYGGVPTLICGPAGGNTCEANEYVDTDSLLAIARTYARCVLDLLDSA